VGRRGLTAGGLAVAAVLVALLLLQGGGGDNDTDPGTTSSTGTETGGGTGSIESQQESAIAEVLRAIDAGEQLPYEQDGGVFQNREGRLPQRPQDYYREYTVPTPGSDDRGARRLVIGAEGETYYTADHYDSFVQIDPRDYR
jgi:ribonuclease T1